jgi:hypothetical protein
MDDPSYSAAQRRVLRRLILKITFVADLLFVAVVMGAILLNGKPDAIIGGLIWTVMGGTMLTIHALFTFDIFKRYVARAAERELAHDTRYEKPKRQSMSISDEGELVELRDDSSEVLSTARKEAQTRKA